MYVCVCVCVCVCVNWWDVCASFSSVWRHFGQSALLSKGVYIIYLYLYAYFWFSFIL